MEFQKQEEKKFPQNCVFINAVQAGLCEQMYCKLLGSEFRAHLYMSPFLMYLRAVFLSEQLTSVFSVCVVTYLCPLKGCLWYRVFLSFQQAVNF